MEDKCNPRLESLTNIVKSLLIREGDTIGKNFRRYYELAKDVYRDLNLYAIRTSKRYLIEVDKNTNSVQIPPDILLVSSVSYIDDCGQIIPLILNKNLDKNIIDINLAKDCVCQCNCESELCGSLKNYEVVYTTVSAPQPGGGTLAYNCYSRKTIYPNGDYFREWNQPVTIFEGGVHTSTVLQDFQEFICKLEVKECGCVKDCPANHDILQECCGPSYMVTECDCKCCPPDFPNDTYGSDGPTGDTLYFNSNAAFTHVLVRGYTDNKKGEIMVPLVAKTTLLRGIMFEAKLYEKGSGYTAMAIQRQQVQFERLFTQDRKRLFRLLNRFSLHEFYQSVIPVRNYPHVRTPWRGMGWIPPNMYPDGCAAGVCGPDFLLPNARVQNKIGGSCSNSNK